MTENTLKNAEINAEKTVDRNRACINCGQRDLWDAGSRCGYDGHYIGYCYTWDDWCRHWRQDKRKPGEIDVYDGDGRKVTRG